MSKYVFLVIAFFAVSAFGEKPLQSGAATQCVTAGCSGQLCVDASLGDVMSTCEWTAAYGCYGKHGTCEAQADGKCGWTPTQTLEQCLANPEKEFPLD